MMQPSFLALACTSISPPNVCFFMFGPLCLSSILRKVSPLPPKDLSTPSRNVPSWKSQPTQKSLLHWSFLSLPLSKKRSPPNKCPPPLPFLAFSSPYLKKICDSLSFLKKKYVCSPSLFLSSSLKMWRKKNSPLTFLFLHTFLILFFPF